jgi:hypothetical protein
MNTESIDGIIIKHVKEAADYNKIVFQDVRIKNHSHVAQSTDGESKLGAEEQRGFRQFAQPLATKRQTHVKIQGNEKTKMR